MAKKATRKKSTRKSESAPVEAIKHPADTRKNIPTEELRDFVPEEPPQTMLYPRDPSLDPQLVWKGKDDQDRRPLEVPVVPIYIQEKIHPQAMIEDIRKRLSSHHSPSDGAPRERQLDLFGDFNGIEDFAQKVDFYHHDQHWSNRMILGDSLLVMTSLAEKEGLKGQVQTIYFDPPYGIKFGSNWQVSTRKRDVKDGKAEDATRQPEQVRAFRDTWELGIHSYLAYLRDRLTAARDLLTETGSVFVQIGDENVHLVRSVMDEVFGSENFVSLITVGKTSGATAEYLPGVSDFVVWFAKSREHLKYRELFETKGFEGKVPTAYGRVEESGGNRRSAAPSERDGDMPHGAKLYALDNLTSPRVREARTGYFPIEMGGKTFLPSTGEWKTHRDGIERLKLARRLEATSERVGYVRYLDDFPALKLGNIWTDTSSSFMADKVYVVQTGTRIIERCLLMTTDPGDLVLDPTCGSGTTAYVAEQWGRRWITLDTSRVALALARTRLMAARFPFYYLAGHYPQIAQMNADEDIRKFLRSATPSVTSTPDIKRGFVYKRVPHVTLKSIANNPDIKEGMTRAQIDAAIARHAETETLYDKPYEDTSKVRVTGPFTVESLSPHRQLSVAQKKAKAAPDPRDGRGTRVIGPDQFGTMIIDNLRKAGIQNRIKDERLKFDTLDPWPGEWIHAVGEYTSRTGDVRKVAVCIGPEHGTVGKELVKEAAKEAVKGLGFDLLVICGFAFDSAVDEETSRHGKLEVQMCRMNPDLSMGDEMLKKTGAGNLFMIFGEPDVRIEKVAVSLCETKPATRGKLKNAALRDGLHHSESDGYRLSDGDRLVVEIFGVDVYDPTTGEIRSDSTDDIACWLIDTDYDSESFFVRHAYFTGADDPYAKLKKALKAEIDEAAWSALYSTRSMPFDRPESGRIAVKVINHYDDEVLKVYQV